MHAFSCHVHMHTCSSRGGGGCVRGGCGATGAVRASPGAHPIILNYDTYIRNYYLCIRFRNCLES